MFNKFNWCFFFLLNILENFEAFKTYVKNQKAIFKQEDEIDGQAVLLFKVCGKICLYIMYVIHNLFIAI